MAFQTRIAATNPGKVQHLMNSKHSRLQSLTTHLQTGAKGLESLTGQ